jgi:hypothetical protein
MRYKKRKKREERLMEAVSFRVSRQQREFLEKIAEERNVGLCEAARIVLSEAMNRAAGAEICQ